MSGPNVSFASGGQWHVLAGAARNTTPPSAPSITSTSTTAGGVLAGIADPISIGGSAISSYTLRAVPQPSGMTLEVSSTGTPIQLNGIARGQSYLLYALVANSIGTSPTSEPVAFSPITTTPVKPQAYNTGYPHGLPGDVRTPVTLTQVTGSEFEDITVAAAEGATLSNYDVHGGFVLRRSNLTFSNCRFYGVPYTSPGTESPFAVAGGEPGASNVTFMDCEFAGNGIPQPDPNGDLNLGWAPAYVTNVPGQTFIRCDIWGLSDGIHPVSRARLESCYIHDLVFFYAPGGETHNDAIQFQDLYEFSLYGNNIDVANFGVSSIMSVESGTVSAPGIKKQITLDSNWLNGAGTFQFSGGPSPIYDEFEMNMVNNRFGLQTNVIWYPTLWHNAYLAGTLHLANNVWNQSGTTSGGQTVTADSPVPLP